MKVADVETIEKGFCVSGDGKAVEAGNGMVSTACPQATGAGVEMLKKGGNAVDAAVAAAFTLGVCEGQASGLGGQTMLLIHPGTDAKVIAVDGSSRAPSLAHVNAIYKLDRSQGYRATTVPSTPAVLAYVHRCFGVLPWEQVLEPAIHYAREGYPVTELQRRLQERELERFMSIESRSGARYFLDNGKPYQTGAIFRQPNLADLLGQIAAKGVEEFYRGNVAKIIDSDMRDNGGLLRYDDLALMPWPIIRPPLKRKFRDMTVYTMPLPGAGRALLFTLLMLNQLPSDTFATRWTDAGKVRLLAEILRKAFLERSDRPFEPNFYPQMETKAMLRSKFARKAVKEVLGRVDTEILASIVSADEESGETTHLSVMDGGGMSVSLTQSIERVYGSKAAADGLGFLYNNYLMDFDYSTPDHPFYLRPNYVPWATVAPSFLFRDSRPWVALGSPGSERIISTLAQVLLDMADHKMSLDRAVAMPRMHCSLGGRISLEAPGFDPALPESLKQKGYRLHLLEARSFYLGCVQAVLRRHTGNGFQGVADIRRDGIAAGY